MRRIVSIALAMLVAGCASAGARTPEAAIAALRRAESTRDPKAAYALLSPTARASVDYAAFEKRWTAATAASASPEKVAATPKTTLVATTHGATTIHDDGLVLRWAKIGRQWMVVWGLPPAPRSSTPAEAIRSFLAAATGTPGTEARALLAPELVDALAEDWSKRGAAIETALAKPGAIELSEDLTRAQLWYEPGRRIVLEQTQSGWRITRFD